MLDLSVILLAYNEELHIRRCLENVCDIAKQVFVIDCFSKDKTQDICREFENVTVLEHEWPVTKYAGQFNWALDNANITTKWVLRLDADEFLLPELKKELQEKLPNMEDDITGIILKRRVIFLNNWIRRGTYPVRLLRIFQYGKGRCEQRLMDEHIQLYEGRTIELDHDFVDHNLNNLTWWSHKQADYAVREAIDLLDIELGLTGAAATDKGKKLGGQAETKRKLKHAYARLPLFVRPFLFFCYTYFLRGAFLEGKVAYVHKFLQVLWYRSLVDAKVVEIKQACGNDKVKIRDYVKTNYNIEIKSKNVSGGAIYELKVKNLEIRVGYAAAYTERRVAA